MSDATLTVQPWYLNGQAARLFDHASKLRTVVALVGLVTAGVGFLAGFTSDAGPVAVAGALLVLLNTALLWVMLGAVRLYALSLVPRGQEE